MGWKAREGGAESLRELEHQVERFVALGYAELAGLDPRGFRQLCEPAIEAVLSSGAARTRAGRTAARVPFALVVTRELIDPEARVPLLSLAGEVRAGVVDRNHWSDRRKGLAPYDPLPGLGIPRQAVYAIVDVDRGDEFRSWAPERALSVLAERGRTPLTIDEGISLAAVRPEILERNHCFMLAGSDRGDRRMPALWIADEAPKLGWCYKGNPHTWLGVASVRARIPDARPGDHWSEP